MGNITKGGCLCGASGFEFMGKVKFAIRCFCRDCQHVSGGGHMPQMGVDAQGWTQHGPIKRYQKTSDAGNTLSFSFCGECGSPMFKSTSKMPDTLFVNAGAVDAVPMVDFTQAVFEDRRAPWDVA